MKQISVYLTKSLDGSGEPTMVTTALVIVIAIPRIGERLTLELNGRPYRYRVVDIEHFGGDPASMDPSKRGVARTRVFVELSKDHISHNDDLHRRQNGA